MYQFLDLTHEQKIERRHLLDWYGALAQISVFLPIVLVQVVALAGWVDRKWLRPSQRAPPVPSSPQVKSRRLQSGFTLDHLRTAWRRFVWWCGDPVDLPVGHVGTKGAVLGAAAWLAWLLALSFVQTGDDFLHLTKRFGIVGASQMPFHYMLALKTPYSPSQLLLRGSQETLIPIHQWLGRIITTMFYLHVTCYLYVFIEKNVLATQLTKAFIICGLVAIVGFTVIGTTALDVVRRRNYRLFYICHVLWATVVLPTLYFHVHHIRLYIWETLLVYLVHAGARWFHSSSALASVKRLPDTDLLEINISKGSAPGGWKTGQYAYLTLAAHSLLRTFKSNPFTVASLPDVDGQLKFVARILDGNTATLAREARSEQKFSLEGPYGLGNHADRLLQYDRVLFVAGGVGATFIVPLYRQLLLDLSPGKGSYRRQKVTFLWTARSLADVTWALPTDAKERDGFTERLSVYLTKNVEDVSRPDAPTSGGDGGVPNGAAVEAEEGIELEERKGLLPRDADGHSEGGLAIYAGRPDLGRAVGQVFTEAGAERIALVVCGPRGLSQSLRRHVGPWVRKGREVWFWEESFAL